MDKETELDNLEYEIEKMDKHRDAIVKEAHRLSDAGGRIANDARVAYLAQQCAGFLTKLKEGLPIKITAEQEQIISELFMQGEYEALGQEIDDILSDEYRKINNDLDTIARALQRDYVSQNRTY